MSQKWTPEFRGGEATSDGPESRRQRERWLKDETEPLSWAASPEPFTGSGAGQDRERSRPPARPGTDDRMAAQREAEARRSGDHVLSQSPDGGSRHRRKEA